MAENIVYFKINVVGDATSVISGITQAVQESTSHINNFTSTMGKIRDVGLAFDAVNSAVGKLTGFLSQSKQAYLEESVEVTKLTQVMRNNMSATNDQIQGILDLTTAQQKLGVISDEIQLAGAQELATYLTKKDSLQKLLPAMNDMLAQQYGLNASQEQAAQIASMLGKVMDGQTGALSRYGYKFDEAQEKILKSGTEAERAAVLYNVVTSAVGGVNEALADTPEGSMKNAANNIGDFQERIGKLWLEIQSKFMPVVEQLMSVGEKVMSFIENNKEVFTALAIVIGTVVVATKGWIIVQGILNVIMALNPIGLIVIGIVALIAAIVYLVVKIKGWATLWEAVVGFITNITKAFVEGIKLHFNTLVDGIMIAIDKIKLGWYKFKEAVGIGDSAENKKMIAQISGDVEDRKKAIVDGAKKVAEHSKQAFDSFKKVNFSFDSSVTMKGTVDKLKGQLGINDNTNQNNFNQDLSTTSNSISSGGKSVKNFNIVIHDGLIKQVDNHFASTNENPQTASDFMWQLSQALQMMLNDMNYAAAG